MEQHLRERLRQLQQEFEQGERTLADLDAKRENVRQTLLRISGAIQVLEEMLAGPGENAGPNAGESG